MTARTLDGWLPLPGDLYPLPSVAVQRLANTPAPEDYNPAKPSCAGCGSQDLSTRWVTLRAQTHWSPEEGAHVTTCNDCRECWEDES